MLQNFMQAGLMIQIFWDGILLGFQAQTGCAEHSRINKSAFSSAVWPH